MQFDHYIPQFVLRNWSDNETSIWTYSTKDGAKRRRIDKSFGKYNLTAYKSVDSSNRSSRSLDPKRFRQSVKNDPEPYDKKIIQPLESKAALIIERMVKRTQLGVRPIDCANDAAILQQFLFLTARRTPESQARAFGDRAKQADNLALFILNRKLQESEYDLSFHSVEDLHERYPPTKIVRDIVRSTTLARFAAGRLQN